VSWQTEGHAASGGGGARISQWWFGEESRARVIDWSVTAHTSSSRRQRLVTPVRWTRGAGPSM